MEWEDEMREILFRGKTKETGEWKYGFVAKNKYYSETEWVIVIEDDEGYWAYWAEVIPETVGQFTGLTDKTGKKIFEGDIVLTEGHSIGVIRYLSDEALFAVNFPSRLLSLRNATSEYIEVIGNIYDNPPELFS